MRLDISLKLTILSDMEGNPEEGKTGMHLNCWEYMSCGRESGGIHSMEFGICPAATDERLDRVHGGKNAGRACWVVAGTLARGNVEGTCASEYDNCAMCDFYKTVKAEEGKYFWPPKLLFKVLGKKAN